MSVSTENDRRILPGVVLFVDDGESYLEIIKERLASRGYMDVCTAVSVGEASVILDGGEVRCLVADWHIDDTADDSGIDFLLDAKKRYPKLTCVLLTGFVCDLSDKQTEKLREYNIAVWSKHDIDSSHRLIEMLSGEGPSAERKLVVDTQDAMPMGELQQRVSQQELRIEGLLEELDRRSLLSAEMAKDLAERLQRIEGSTKADVVSTLGMRSIEDLVYDLKELNPNGQRLLRLYNAVLGRILGGDKK